MNQYEELFSIEDYVEKINNHFADCINFEDIKIKYENLALQINLNSSSEFSITDKYLLIELLIARRLIAESIVINESKY